MTPKTQFVQVPLSEISVKEIIKKFENDPNKVNYAMDLLNNSKTAIDEKLLTKITNADLSDKSKWIFFEIKHLKVLFAEYQDDNKGIYISIKTTQYEQEAGYVISFHKEQVLIKNSGAVDSVTSEAFVEYDYAMPYILQFLELYLTKFQDAVHTFDVSLLPINIYK